MPESTLPVGLTEAHAQSRLRSEGFNELRRAQSRTLRRIAYDVVSEPMFGLLIAAGLVYLALGDLREASAAGLSPRSR